MQLEEVRAEMEQELTWRHQELVFLGNITGYVNKEEDKEKYRKALIVMLYAHFEGFCKTCLLIYIKAINDLKISRKVANDSLVTSSMEEIFNRYDDLDRKCKVFKRQLPDDSKLHRFYRRTDFTKEFNDFLEEDLFIQDNIVNTESNLHYIVLKKNLFKLGIDYTIFNQFENSIDSLVNKRNSIAHGSERYGVKENEFMKVQSDILKVMNKIIKILMENIMDEKYKR